MHAVQLIHWDSANQRWTLGARIDITRDLVTPVNVRVAHSTGQTLGIPSGIYTYMTEYTNWSGDTCYLMRAGMGNGPVEDLEPLMAVQPLGSPGSPVFLPSLSLSPILPKHPADTGSFAEPPCRCDSYHLAVAGHEPYCIWDKWNKGRGTR